MNRDEVADLCESLPGAWPDSPWGEDDLVYKLGNRNAEGKGGKIFCFVGGGTTEGPAARDLAQGRTRRSSRLAAPAVRGIRDGFSKRQQRLIRPSPAESS